MLEVIVGTVSVLYHRHDYNRMEIIEAEEMPWIGNPSLILCRVSQLIECLVNSGIIH